MAASIASSQSVSIPINSIKKPSSDLIFQNRILDPAEASQLVKDKQIDLSLLNPKENKFWQNQNYAVSDSFIKSFPAPEVGANFQDVEAVINELLTVTVRVQSRANSQNFYRLSLSRYSHSFMMRAALLRKLGFYVPALRQYQNFKLFFKNEETKDSFLKNMQSGMTIDVDDTPWITENDRKNHSLTLADCILETPSSEYYDLHWGTTPNPNNPELVPILELFSKTRAFRSLIIPYVLVDLPESVNRFTPKIGSVLSGHVVLSHPFGGAFGATTYEDVRWLLRRMQNWTPKDYLEIVQNALLPKEIENLVWIKLLYRSKNLFELFNLSFPQLQNIPNLNYNSPEGHIINGKVSIEFIPPFPQRFSHGDPDSPFSEADIFRYFKIRGITTILSTGLSEISKHLQVLSTQSLAKQRVIDIQNQVKQHIKDKPWEPLYQKVESWGGPVAGFNVSATRHVSTGTYYDSTAPVQLIDNLSISGSLGYFMSVDGLNNLRPFAGANLNLLRDYTHVRPILSMSEGDRESWKNLIIPQFMKNISKVLESSEAIVDENNKSTEPLDKFLLDLREGEVFTITDSITAGIYSQLSSSLDVILGMSPMNFMSSVNLGGDASRIILRQTSISKTKNGLQIYVRKQKSSVYGLNFDVNYFINLLKIRSQTQLTDLSTDAFIINYDPSLQENIDQEQTTNEFVKKNEEIKKDLQPVLLKLFQNNSKELLYEKFKYQKFSIDHKIKNQELRTKLLWMKVIGMKEDHLLKLRYPASPLAPELDPKDEEVTLYSAKRGQLVGYDFLGFGIDILQSIINKKSNLNWQLNPALNPNPANTPYGRSFWKIVNTEGDLTTTQKKTFPSISLLQHVWGGWNISRDSFFNILDEIEKKISTTKLASYRLLERENFHQVKKIDFYRITAQLSLLPGALKKITDLMVQPSEHNEIEQNKVFVGSLFRKLSTSLGGKVNLSEKELFNQVMTILGDGSYQVGWYQFNQECLDYLKSQTNGEGLSVNSGFWLNGNYYECLTPWIQKLLKLSAKFPKDKKQQIQWLSEVIFLLDEKIPVAQLMKYLGEENYIYLVRINGFRNGDEDGDIQYFSNTLGDPTTNIDYANGLIQMFATRTGISPIELDRSEGSFR
ncbi:MAG: hypothetical protein HUU56_06740 [Bdellovibrionaceae bacterium]|nr:hypothetical protein [Pseudobdellovibrionaceae bacterium]